jgi:hypothetical protein
MKEPGLLLFCLLVFILCRYFEFSLVRWISIGFDSNLYKVIKINKN